MNSRNDALINGALITLGGLAVLDNALAHRVLELHRAVPDARMALLVEAVDGERDMRR